MSPSLVLAFGNFGATELLLVLAVLLLLFGGSKLPSLARGLGQSVKEFKKASQEDDKPAATAATAAVEPKKTESGVTTPTETK